ncbi:MAG: hypothetical protein IJW25_00305 [Clostridia bacterium]|nr:hypothetical protein [Clostridia bacterium]
MLFSFSGCGKEDRIFGVWWWDDTLGVEYLNFAESNGVTEIYYCNSDFDESTANFIKQANDKGIKVYWLDGDYRWLSDATNLHNKLNKYINFQNNYPKSKFAGVHLDIEPHQNEYFDIQREELITSLIELIADLKQTYTNILFDYDIPFWLDDEITYNNSTKPAYQYVIDIAERTFLMSYRDDAESIYNVSEDEIEYAKLVNKVIVLGVETQSSEGDNVSFQEEGKQFMNQEITKLKELIPANFGICVHQIKTWFSLQN